MNFFHQFQLPSIKIKITYEHIIPSLQIKVGVGANPDLGRPAGAPAQRGLGQEKKAVLPGCATRCWPLYTPNWTTFFVFT
jgi:hypothetical protein